MPTYDYRCPNGHDFERFFRKISDAEPELTCPVCGAVATRRVSGGAGLLFKGSGFYLTDYGKNAHRKSGLESSSNDSKSDSSGESKSSAPTPTSKTEGGSASSGTSESSSPSTKSDSAKSDAKTSSKPKGDST